MSTFKNFCFQKQTLPLRAKFFYLPLLIMYCTFSFPAYGEKKSNILILHSYHADFSWSKKFTLGIKAALKPQQSKVSLAIEYMDTKRFSSNNYYEHLFKFLEFKYHSTQFELIISVDDNALIFLQTYKKRLFPNTPVVFGGVNNFVDHSWPSREEYTGVTEEINIASTINLALQLHPKIEEILVIRDQTLTGKKLHQQVSQVLGKDPQSPSVTFLGDGSFAELLETLKTKKGNQLILFTAFFRDNTGKIFESDEVIEQISQSTDLPLYGVLESYLGRGIIGGLLTGGFTEGKKVGELAVRVLAGEKVTNIPLVRQSPYRYMFDYLQLNKHNIALSALPPNSTIINEPFSFTFRQRFFLLVGVIAILIQFTIIFLLTRSILKRRKLQSDLSAALKQQEVILDNSRVGIAFFRHHNLIWSNDRFKKMFGYREEEYVGSLVTKFYNNAQDQQQLIKEAPSLFRSGKSYHAEFLMKRQNDSTFWAHVSGLALTPHDFSQGVIWEVEDIHQRKTAEQENRRQEKILRESEKKFRLLFQHSNDMILIHDAEEQIVDINQKALTLLGFTEQESLKSYMRQLFCNSSECQGIFEHSSKLLQSQDFVQFEVLMKKKSGDLFPVEVSSSAIEIEGHRLTQSIIRDIAEQRKYQEGLKQAKQAAEEAAKAKSDFLAIMSHEIRTPMNGVIGMTDLLACTNLTEDQKEYVQLIEISGNNLMRVINDILDFSKIEADKLEIENTPFELRPCIENIVNLLSEKAFSKSLDLFFWISPRVPTRLGGDVLRLQQILMNIIGNAIKFTNTGEILVLVTQLRQEGDQLTLQCSVQDTGIGIPPEQLDSLFEAFSQVDSSITRKFGGTGLGLAISKRLVELMGGEIKVESTLGKGSIFSFTIQTTVLTDTAINSEALIPSNLKGKRALILDTHQKRIEILAQLLTSWEILPTIAQDPTIAVDLLAQETFDFVIIDQFGWAIFQAQPFLFTKITDLPILLIHSPQEVPAKNYAQLSCQSMNKPIRPQQLLQQLENLLSPNEDQVTSPQEVQANPVEIDLITSNPLEIILAEDNIINQLITQKILTKLGYHTDIVNNGLELLQACKKKSYDLILMDIQMPQMNGVEATQEIRQTLPPDKQPKIIAMTANALKGDREKYLASGMDGYLSKPVRIKDIETTLKELSTASISLPLAECSIREAGEVLDMETVESRIEISEGLLGDLLETYYQETPRQIAMIKQYTASKNYPKLHEASHKLKGMSANLGAQWMHQSCIAIEAQIHSEQPQNLPLMVQQLEESYTQTQKEFQKILER